MSSFIDHQARIFERYGAASKVAPSGPVATPLPRPARDRYNAVNNISEVEKMPKSAMLVAPLSMTTITALQLWHAWLALYLSPVVVLPEETLWQRYVFCLGLTVALAIQQVSLWGAFVMEPVRLPPADQLLLNGRPLHQLVEAHPELVKEHLSKCDRCEAMRPPRCHHCRLCRGCILEFDHHCTALGTCIHAGNYKHFLLVCIYSAVGSLSLLGLLLQNGSLKALVGQGITFAWHLVFTDELKLLQPWANLAAEPLSLLGILGFAFLFFMLAMVAMGTTFMACVHIFMVLRGTSTLQVLRHMDATDDREGIVTQLCFGKAKPGVGVPTSLWERIKRVFGSNILLMPFPILTARDRARAVQIGLGPLQLKSAASPTVLA